MSRRVLRSIEAVAACVCFAIACTGEASAQTKPAPNLKPKRAKEFLIGGLFSGPTSVGSADANLLDGAGNPAVKLFSTTNRLIGFGLEANMTAQLRKAWWVEIAGGFTRLSLKSKIQDDFENAGDTTTSMMMSRFLVEGAVLRYFHDKGKSAWFVRFGAGWMREAAGGATLTGDGLIGGGGLGFRRWWRTNGKGAVKRVGLRLEGRGEIRSGGISLGEKNIRFGPSGAGHLVFGF